MTHIYSEEKTEHLQEFNDNCFIQSMFKTEMFLKLEQYYSREIFIK